MTDFPNRTMGRRELFTWGRSGERSGSRVLDRLREELQQNQRITAWSMEQRFTRSKELYLAGRQVESVREGEERRVQATLYVQTARPAGDVMGAADLLLSPGEEDRVQEKVEQAVSIALESEFEPFPLPEPGVLPVVETIDAVIDQDPGGALEDLRASLLGAIGRERGVRLASAEFFLRRDVITFENSNGLTADRSGTRVTGEVVLLGAHPNGEEAEIQDLRYRRRIHDLDLDSWISGLAEQTRDASIAEPMPSWSGPVVIRADALREYLGPIVGRTSARSVYQEQPSWDPGESVADGEIRGDGITVVSDATLPFGLRTVSCDGEGVPAQRVRIVANGIFRRRWATQRYAHYLGAEATGSFANLVVEPGTASTSEIFRGPEVLEPVRFSWLNPSRMTGDFSSEIRLGYLHRGGRRIPMRGGSLNGNVFTSLADCRLSRDQVFVGDGKVPAHVRFNGLDVSGV